MTASPEISTMEIIGMTAAILVMLPSAFLCMLALWDWLLMSLKGETGAADDISEMID